MNSKRHRIRNLGNRGVTLVWVLASLMILGIAATQLGKMLFFTIRSKDRMEAKTSIIDNESTFIELIAGRLKSIVEARIASTGSACGLTTTNLNDGFKSPVLYFPAPAIPIKIETNNPEEAGDYAIKGFTSALSGTQANFQKELKAALTACGNITVPQTPAAANPNPPGVFKFCVGLNQDGLTRQKTKSFLFSEYAMAEVRVDLVHQGLTQNEKTFHSPPSCAAWSTATSRQFKVIYRVFWKSYQDPQGYFSWMGSKTFNLSELRAF